MKELLMNIFEIIGATPLPFKWLDEERAVFKFNDIKFGIYANYQILKLDRQEYNIVNVAFGIFDKIFRNESDLNTSLTTFKRPLTIFSTVANACLANNQIINCDHICMIGQDENKEKRASLYSVAAGEIVQGNKHFKSRNITFAHTQNGSLIVAISKQKLTNDEAQKLADNLGVGKIEELPSPPQK